MNPKRISSRRRNNDDKSISTQNPVAFLLTDVNIFEHHQYSSVALLRFIHIASEQPIHIAGIRTAEETRVQLRTAVQLSFRHTRTLTALLTAGLFISTTAESMSRRRDDNTQIGHVPANGVGVVHQSNPN
jgi:hypothetical protein